MEYTKEVPGIQLSTKSWVSICINMSLSHQNVLSTSIRHAFICSFIQQIFIELSPRSGYTYTCVFVYIHIYVDIYSICVCLHTYVYVYIYTQTEAKKERSFTLDGV